MSEDTPDDIIHDLLASAAYGEHALGYPILGTEDHLNTFTEDTLRQYMEERYIPENIVVSVAGNVDDSFFDKIDAYFGSMTTDYKPLSLVKPNILSKSIEKYTDTEKAHLCIVYNGLPVDDDKMYSLILMNNALGYTMSSKLFQEVREQQGLAYY